MFYVKTAIMWIVGSVWYILITVIDLLLFAFAALNKGVRESWFFVMRMIWGKGLTETAKAYCNFSVSTVYTDFVEKMYPELDVNEDEDYIEVE